MSIYSSDAKGLRGRISLAIWLGLYIVAFFFAQEIFGVMALGLAIFPILFGGWYLGISGGFLAAILSMLLSTGILYLDGEANPWFIVFVEGLIDILILFSAAFLIGYLSLINEKDKATISRSNKLIHALTHISTRMKISSNPDDVMVVMGEELNKISIKVLVALLIPGSQEMTIRYTSLDPKIVEKFERLARKGKMGEFRVSVENLPSYLNLAENKENQFLDNYEEAISALLPGFSDDIVKRILRSGNFTESALIGHFPLIYQENSLGFLWLWGDDLQEEDIDTFSFFADQVAANLENARLFDELQKLAITDGLTKLYTRRHFFELAYEEFYRARRYGHPLSLIMLDLDYFKQINDTFGHLAGDIVLEKTAEICKTVLRAQDVIGRYGGEEFIILLVETKLSAAQNVAERIKRLLASTPIQTEKGTINLTISGGVAGDNVEELNLIDMIELADQALYAAKEAGRNNIQLAELSLSPD